MRIKIERLSHFLNASNPDIVLITEHGLNTDNLINTRIPGYNLVGGFARQHHRKGGVAIFASSKIKNKIDLISISDDSSELLCETALIKICLGKELLYLLGVYRTPHSNLEGTIDTILTELDKIINLSNHIIIMGDINMDSLTDNEEKKKERERLNEALNSYNIRRLKLPPTRVTHDSRTSIDFICTNINENYISSSVVTTGLSDHTAQICSVETNSTKNSAVKYKQRAINNKTMEELRIYLEAQDWAQVTCKVSTDAAFNAFNRIFKVGMDICCPYKIRKSKPNSIKKVYDAETETLKKSYLEARNKEILTNHPDDKKESALRKKTYDLRLKELRKKSNADFIEKADNKSKALWKIINNERKEKPPNLGIEEIDVDGEMTHSPVKIAKHLNQYFSTIAEKTLDQNRTNELAYAIEQTSNHPIQNLFLYDTTFKEINEIIDGMKPKSSAGEDDISSKIIKHCKNSITVPLTEIINKSLRQGIFPNSLKLAKVYPKHKSGTTTEASSYRPISLTSNISKILERVVLKRLLDHLRHHNILTSRQHGFMKNRSTTTAITQLVELILDELEQGSAVTSILLDFSKAFDCLDHNLIIKKLTTLGVTGNELNWFTSYLDNRRQLVELTYIENQTIHTIKSEPVSVRRGVPQGSVLGPALYILLTNDFPKFLEDFCETVMFADDTALIVASKSKEQLDVNSYVAYNMAKQYCHQNDLVLNENKTYQLMYTTTTNHLNGLPEVTTIDNSKYLGIILDNRLSWEPHINQLCKKLNSSLYVIRRLKQISNNQVAKTAYYSLFESHLRYGLLVWGATSATNLQRIMVIQKRAIRALNGLGPRDSCRNDFRQLKILTAVALYILQTILYVVETGQTRLVDQHNYNTRHRNNFALAPHHLSLFEKKPSYRGAVYFNTLPDSLKNLPRKNLKKALTDWLLQRSIYSIQEFLDWRRHEA